VVLNRLDDLRITQVRPLLPPAILLEEIPITERASELVSATRQAIANVLSGQDPRLVIVVGPCSIHDTRAAVEYAEKLLPLRQRYADQLIVTMRSYFEKPRTSVGWKGLINDPDLDESFHINKGLRMARQLLVDLNDMGLPTASEFLDTQIPQYIADLTSWVAIGARTTESQVHRELASGSRCRWASRTAPTARRRPRWTPCSRRARRTSFRRSPSRACRPSSRRAATTPAT
jgi:3-deoxy-7-phosphoheptulonate synthase